MPSFRMSLVPLAVFAIARSDGPLPTAVVRQAVVATANEFSYAPLLVRPAAGSSSTMFGVLHLWIGTPPNPITPPSPICALPAVQNTNEFLLCGYLRNPDGESLQNAVLTLTLAGVTEEVRVEVPPSPVAPCETVFLMVTGSLATVNPGPPGINPGPPEVNPGPPDVSAVLLTDVGTLTGQSPGLSDGTEAGQLLTPAPPTNPSCTVQVVR
jgi:hypothetical protein